MYEPHGIQASGFETLRITAASLATKRVSHVLDAFKKRCHEVLTCFGFASIGLVHMEETFRPKLNGDPKQRLLLGTGHPDEGKTHSEILMAEAVEFSRRDGEFSDILAKALFVTLYAEWDERYRQLLAQELGVDSQLLQSDLMGDLRFIRHWVVHNKSMVDKKTLRLIDWPVVEGDRLIITIAMFNQFIDLVNVMEVRVGEAPPANPSKIKRPRR